jgi:hypothetical protein
MPLFSAMNTRPSGANAAAVGEVSPVITALSVKPGGVTATAGRAASPAAITAAVADSDSKRLVERGTFTPVQ